MIHIYTGDGKGKTTAAFGLALRAAGAGLKVYICQFLKGKDCSEHKSLKKIKNIKIERFGTSCFIKGKPSDKDKRLARQGFDAAKNALSKGFYSMVILDEMNPAISLGLVGIDELVMLMLNTDPKTELVITGRGAHPKAIKNADLVSDIKERKHYFKKGVKARKGIEF